MGFPFVAGGEEIIRQEFDFGRNYAAYHAAAKAAFLRKAQMTDCDLVRRGADKVRVFTPAEAAAIRDRIDGGLTHWTDRKEIADLVLKVFNPAMDRRLISYFQSEYTPTKIGFSVHQGEGSLKVSGGWHCDGGPAKHVVVIVYFTPSEGVTGNTLFGDLQTTAKLKDAGYIFCRTQDRIDNLAPVLDELGMPDFDEWHFDVEAGEALIFDAPNLMHKGVPPVSGRRYTMAVAVVPNNRHWMEEYRAGDFPFPEGRATGTFPSRRL